MHQVGGHQVHGKVGLRKSLRRRRNALGPAHQARAAANVVERLTALPAFRRSERIALYLANDGEIDPAEILRWSLAHAKRCYAPVIAGRADPLRFAEITARTRFENNRFGIAEPVVPAERLMAARELDLVLVPLVGFDRHGNRIGMGGGFYDRTFAFKKTRPGRLPQLVGLAHEIQRVDEIDADNWDIPIAAVVTERRVYRCVHRCDSG